MMCMFTDVSRQTDHRLHPRQNVRGPYASNNTTGFKQERYYIKMGRLGNLAILHFMALSIISV